VRAAWEWIKSTARAIKKGLLQAWEWIKSIARAIKKGLLQAWEWIKALARAIRKELLQAWEWLKEVAQAIGMAMLKFLACFGPKIPFCFANFFQTKLEVKQPGDTYEQEADRIADQISRMSQNGHYKQRSTLENPNTLAVTRPYRQAISTKVLSRAAIQRYSRDIHYDRTKEDAELYFVDKSIAETIATEDQGVDEGWSHPWRAFARETFNPNISDDDLIHFPSREVAEAELEKSIDKCDVSAFGRALHRYQDTYSHNFTTWPTPAWRICASCCWLLGPIAASILFPNPAHGRRASFKHVCLFTYPDQHNPEQQARDAEMRRGTRFWIRKLRNKIRGGCQA
jgi:hypothetical protein